MARELTSRTVTVKTTARISTRPFTGIRVSAETQKTSLDHQKLDLIVTADGDELLSDYLHEVRRTIDNVLEELEREGQENPE